MHFILVHNDGTGITPTTYLRLKVNEPANPTHVASPAKATKFATREQAMTESLLHPDTYVERHIG